MGDRSRVLRWAERGALPADRLPRALALLRITPAAEAWRRFVDGLALWAGVSALGAALVFFVAANWSAIGRWAKLGILEAVIVAAVVGYVGLGPDRPAGKASLLGASLALGALLALAGQTYQTGADTFELFASWAALMLPWALVGRLAALWIVWLVVVHLAVVLYFAAFGGLFGLLLSTEAQLWSLAALDTGALAVWELARRRAAWLHPRWAPRILAAAGAGVVTALAVQAIVSWSSASGAIAVLFPLWLLAGYAVYRRRLPDAFMLATGCLAVIVVATTLLARALGESVFDDTAEGFLVIALCVVAMAGRAAAWLRRVAGEQAA